MKLFLTSILFSAIGTIQAPCFQGPGNLGNILTAWKHKILVIFSKGNYVHLLTCFFRLHVSFFGVYTFVTVFEGWPLYVAEISINVQKKNYVTFLLWTLELCDRTLFWYNSPLPFKILRKHCMIHTRFHFVCFCAIIYESYVYFYFLGTRKTPQLTNDSKADIGSHSERRVKRNKVSIYIYISCFHWLVIATNYKAIDVFRCWYCRWLWVK